MFLSVLLHLDVVSNRKSCSRLRFILQIATFFSGAEGIRTPDLRRAKAALSQLSYGPEHDWWREFTAVAGGGLIEFEAGCCTRAPTRRR